MLRVVAAFHEEVFSDPTTPSGLNKVRGPSESPFLSMLTVLQSIDFRSVTLAHDANLTQYHEEWTKRFAEGSDPNDRGSAFRCTLLPLYVILLMLLTPSAHWLNYSLTNYSRLVMFSFGFQQAYHRGFQPGDEIFFTKVIHLVCSCLALLMPALHSVLRLLNWSSRTLLRCLPLVDTCGSRRTVCRIIPFYIIIIDMLRILGHFVFSSFASAFLLKVCLPFRVLQ